MRHEGDAEFSRILETQAGPMYRQALRILGNREDAEDAVQDALVRIWKHRRSFAHRSHIATWVFRITYNACLSVKARRERSKLLARDLAGEVSGNAVPPPTRTATSGEDLSRLLSLLPPLQAAALSLFYVEELEYKEIADVLKIPPGSVATAIHRGKQRLREILTRQEGTAHGKL
jgi:RNA polymerase sigma-70 factor (ECF subfamily)